MSFPLRLCLCGKSSRSIAGLRFRVFTIAIARMKGAVPVLSTASGVDFHPLRPVPSAIILISYAGLLFSLVVSSCYRNKAH